MTKVGVKHWLIWSDYALCCLSNLTVTANVDGWKWYFIFSFLSTKIGEQSYRSPFTQTYINKIEMVQRRAVRWVSSNYSTYASVSSMLDSLEWRSLEDRRADARLILFYKIEYNLVAVPLPQYINQPVRTTRHMHPLHFVQIPATASYYKCSFFPLAIVQWNRLPNHIPVLSDLDSFRSAVRTVSHLMP